MGVPGSEGTGLILPEQRERPLGCGSNRLGEQEGVWVHRTHEDVAADEISPGRDRRVQGDSLSEATRGQVWGSRSGIHGQLQPLLDVHLDLSSTIFVKRFEGTEHGIQSDQAADKVVKIHVPSLI